MTMAKKTARRKLTRGQAVKKKTAKHAEPKPDVENTQSCPLSDLQLDGSNARLGASAGQFRNQADILDTVVEVSALTTF